MKRENLAGALWAILLFVSACRLERVMVGQDDTESTPGVGASRVEPVANPGTSELLGREGEIVIVAQASELALASEAVRRVCEAIVGGERVEAAVAGGLSARPCVDGASHGAIVMNGLGHWSSVIAAPPQLAAPEAMSRVQEGRVGISLQGASSSGRCPKGEDGVSSAPSTPVANPPSKPAASAHGQLDAGKAPTVQTPAAQTPGTPASGNAALSDTEMPIGSAPGKPVSSTMGGTPPQPPAKQASPWWLTLAVRSKDSQYIAYAGGPLASAQEVPPAFVPGEFVARTASHIIVTSPYSSLKRMASQVPLSTDQTGRPADDDYFVAISPDTFWVSASHPSARRVFFRRDGLAACAGVIRP